MTQDFSTVELLGMQLASLRTEELLDHIFRALEAGQGGWLVTANLDFLRRYVRDADMRQMYGQADVRVADGMPLVWASRLLGTPLPERVAGSSLLWPLFQRAAQSGRSVYLLGGDPTANAAAAEKLTRELPGLRVVGHEAPWVSAPPTASELAAMRENLVAAAPDLVLVAFGSPKQEQVIAALRENLPGAWWMGIGISLSFLAGHVQRAPTLLQKAGLEWMHRLAQEPRRLFRRYVIEDIPFAVELFGKVAVERARQTRA